MKKYRVTNALVGYENGKRVIGVELFENGKTLAEIKEDYSPNNATQKEKNKIIFKHISYNNA